MGCVPLSPNASAPPSKSKHIDCEQTPQEFNPNEGDELYDCEDVENNATDEIVNDGNSK